MWCFSDFFIVGFKILITFFQNAGRNMLSWGLVIDFKLVSVGLCLFMELMQYFQLKPEERELKY